MKKMLMIGLIAFVFSSCQSEPAKQENVITPTPTGVPSASSETAPSGERPANNPAHGQPFHDCTLPVGAAFAVQQSPAQPSQATAPVAVQ